MTSRIYWPEWLKKILKSCRKDRYFLLAPLAFTSFFFLLAEAHILTPLESLTVDKRFRTRAPFDPPASDKLLFVAIDEDSLKRAGAWPWPRAVHRDFLKLINCAQPATVAFDVAFTETSTPEMDQSLAEGIDALTVPVITSAISDAETTEEAAGPSPDNLGLTTPITQVEGDTSKVNHAFAADYPIELLRSRSYFGFADSNPDGRDGIRRHLPLLVRIKQNFWPTLVTQTLLQYWKITPAQMRVKLGQFVEFLTPDGIRRVPINQAGEIEINYRNTKSFATCGYMRLTRALIMTYLKDQKWPDHLESPKGRIVLIGQWAAGHSDLGPSPLEFISPLPMVHMNVLNSILRNDYLTIVPDGYMFLAWLILGYVTLYGLRNSSAQTAILVPCGLVLGYILLAFAIFWSRSILLPIVWTTVSFLLLHVGALILHWVEELHSKQAIKEVFASYISPGIMNNLLKDPDSIKLGGARKPVTIFFSDIRGFTSISEGADEEELVRHLNEYFQKMVDCVGRYDGTLHKYIGDAIMAVWGDVLTGSPNLDAKNAVRTTLAMKKALVGLNKYWKENGRIELQIGMGLNHGIVCVGNIGASQRREFTVIGDAVNLASRLEGMTKKFHTDLCIGETVHQLLDGEFLTRTIGLIVLKGVTRPMRVYEVLEDLRGLEPMNFTDHDWVRQYELAFEAYLARDFYSASRLFQECLEQHPDDFLSSNYYESSLALLQEPPGEDWDGVIALHEK